MGITCSALQTRFAEIRARSLALRAGLSDEDCAAQAMPDASPLKWHLAHTTWFFEAMVMQPYGKDFVPFHPAYRSLWNSYYQSVGSPFPRPQRGLLTRPAMSEVLRWRAQLDAQMDEWLNDSLDDDPPAQALALIELGLQHEQQHQELMLTDVLALMAVNPLRPAVLQPALPPEPEPRNPFSAQEERWIRFDGGPGEMGHEGQGFCFDNETPRHRVWLAPFAIAASLVTNRDYLAFVEQGGYRQPQWWLAEGWEWLKTASATDAGGLSPSRRSHPLYWRQAAHGWMEFSLHGEQALDGHAPVSHLSLYEADAYARWRGLRLPTEQEWEHAARTRPEAFSDLFGECWQWTASPYVAYPGFQPLAGTPGEYNGKFMINQQVLRGSSRFTAPGHARLTYRNFFPASACWQRTGLRLAASGHHIH